MSANRFTFNMEDRVPEGGPISSEEIAAMEYDIDPANIIADHQRKQSTATDRIQALKMQRLQEENAALLASANEASSTAQALAIDQANMRGQLEMLQRTATPQVDPELHIDEDMMATHGHAKEFVSKVAKIESTAGLAALRAELKAENDAAIAALRAEYAGQMQAQRQELNNINGTIQSNFESEVRKACTDVGLNYDALIAGDEAFMAYASQPLAVGVNKLWATQLEDNINDQDLPSTVAMLRQYSNHVKTQSGGQVPADSQELPQTSGARALSPQAQSSLTQRQKFMERAEAIQDQFLNGVYPGTQEEYQIEKAKLLNQADEIPLPV